MSSIPTTISARPGPAPAVLRPVVEVFRHPLVRVVVRRLLLAIPLLIIVSALSFVLLSLAPGDPAREILGQYASLQEISTLRRQLGLDQSLPVQYWDWVKHALSGNLGTSILSHQPVEQTISQGLPVTISLIVGGLVVMPTLGVALGIYSAVRAGPTGRFVDALAVIGFAVPSFWLAAVLLELFAVKVHWFPAVGYVPIAQSPTQWLRSITLPVIALSLGGVAWFAKYTREAMLDVLSSEHVRMAWACGIPARAIFFRFALKNAGSRVVTLVGLLTIGLLGGTVYVEQIFGLPGLGSALVTASQQKDVPVVEGITVFFTLIIILVNLITDLAYTWLDPRVRTT